MMGYGSDPGLIPRFCRELFDCIQTNDKVRVCVCVCVCVCVRVCVCMCVCASQYILYAYLRGRACVSVSCFHR
jgi:hypothetical protein